MRNLYILYIQVLSLSIGNICYTYWDMTKEQLEVLRAIVAMLEEVLGNEENKADKTTQ